MTRTYEDITYTAPLTPPLKTQAYVAADPGDWRLIVFHGTPANRYLYARFLRTAPPGVEVVIPARPGFGKGHEKAYTSFDDQIDAIKPFLPTSHGGLYGDKKIITMGVSYGGELALKAAIDYPDAVNGVVTVSALIEEPHDYALILEKLGADARVEQIVPNRWRKTRDEVGARRGQIGPLLEAAKTMSQPVEIIHGDFDGIVHRSNSLALKDILEDKAHLEIIPGGTHYLEAQYPRRLHAAVQRVIARSGA